MSLLKSNSVQIGQSATATQNFTLSVPSSPDGTIKLARGNSGATTADVLTVNASGAITGATITSSTVNGGTITSGTATASTSGTAIDFTGIPSWAKRITVMFNGVSTNGSSNCLLQIGSGSVLTTGYDSGASSFNDANAGSTIGFVLTAALAGTSTVSGSVVLVGINPSTNTWVSSGNVSNTANPPANGASHLSGGNVALSGTLDRVRLTTINGTDTFDAGTVNIMYEG